MTRFLSEKGTITGDIVKQLGLKAAGIAALQDAAELFAAEWRKTLSGPGSGRVYTQELRTIRAKDGSVSVKAVGPRQPPKKPSHTASAPGDPPAIDTQALRDSIHTAREGDTVKVASDDEAAPITEFGVTNHPAGIVILPRPHARPTFDRIRGKLTVHIVQSLRARAQRRDPRGRFSGGFRKGTSFA